MVATIQPVPTDQMYSSSENKHDTSSIDTGAADSPKLASVPEEAMPSFLFQHFLHKNARLSKLVTREDPYHMHKTLGILSVCNFLYRYAYVYPTTGSLGFSQGRMVDWLSMMVHMGLACSSILFRVPRKRITDKPMVIYEEYRQHAIVFTSRCFFIFVAAMIFHASSVAPYVGVLVVLIHHLIADRITIIHGTTGNTAVRATAKHAEVSPFYRGVSNLYSLYQFLAIGSHLIPNARLADLGFNAVIAIQSSAFLMTLYRKRIIRGRAHMAIYASCLAVSTFHILRLLHVVTIVLIIVSFIVRISLPRHMSNKYAIWTVFILVTHLCMRLKLVSDTDMASFEVQDVLTSIHV
jgi:hypothetical protein